MYFFAYLGLALDDVAPRLVLQTRKLGGLRAVQHRAYTETAENLRSIIQPAMQH